MNRVTVIRLKRWPVSFRVQWRVLGLLMVLGGLGLAAMIINLGLGEYPIPPRDVIRTVLGKSQEFDYIVNNLRLPRALVGYLVGAALGVSGAILQGLTRNALAAPDVVGVTGGASLAAVGVIVLAPDAPALAVPLAAVTGAAAAGLVTYLLAWRKGSSPIRLLLVGIGVAAVAHALVTLLMTMAPVFYVNQALVWITGSVYARSWPQLRQLLPWVAMLVPLACLLARHLDVLHLGDEPARALGSQVEWQRTLQILISMALAGAAVAVAGTVGFVGLMSPHIARRLAGPGHGGLLPTAAMVGGLMVVLADMAGRTLFAPIEIPVGVVTAGIGAPYFIYLLRRSRHA